MTIILMTPVSAHRWPLGLLPLSDDGGSLGDRDHSLGLGLALSLHRSAAVTASCVREVANLITDIYKDDRVHWL